MKYIKLSALLIVLAVTIILNSSTSNATIKTSGKDAYGNDWSYDAATKTLTFTGEGKAGADFIMDGHSPEPEWFDLHRETEKVVFSENITEIGAGTCDGFAFTKKIELPQTLEKIGENAFFRCVRLESVEFPNSLRVLGNNSFHLCSSLKIKKLNEGLEIIGDGALRDNIAEKIVVPSTVTQIGNGAFWTSMKLKEVILPEGLKSIGIRAFRYCPKLEKITIPSTVTQIGVGAFSYSGIKKIEIPKGVKNIFYDKDELLLPEEKGLFLGCKNLRKVVIKSKKITKIAKNSFYKTGKKVKIYVPKGKKKKYTKLFREKGKLSKNSEVVYEKKHN